MAVRRKPKTEEEFIQGANSDITSETNVISNQQSLRNQIDVDKPLKLRVPESLLAEIDGIVRTRKPKISRHNWILEALYEKVERDSK
jgi:hypothetical protein